LILAGIVDCVAVVGSTVCLVDWKTSEKTKLTLKSLYDAPVQLAAYIGNSLQ
jgi:ATP-dependent exoDNAse (exonuclease V) beta subunit